MNVYVETNFILELVFAQEQATSCEQILQLCESRKAALIIPAYSLAEPHEKMIRQTRKRRNLRSELDIEIRQLLRTLTDHQRIDRIQEVADLLIESTREERQRWERYLKRILNIAYITPLTADILADAATCEITYRLSPQDALVLASVMENLQEVKSQTACFLNRNTKDFSNPDIQDISSQFNCQMIPNFDQGYQFIVSRLDA